MRLSPWKDIRTYGSRIVISEAPVRCFANGRLQPHPLALSGVTSWPARGQLQDTDPVTVTCGLAHGAAAPSMRVLL